MENENRLKLDKVESHGRMHKRKRVNAEKSVEAAASVQEAKQERKGKRKQTKDLEEDDEKIQKNDEFRSQVESGDQARSDHQVTSDPESKSKKRKKDKNVTSDKRGSSGKMKRHKHREVLVMDESEGDAFSATSAIDEVEVPGPQIVDGIKLPANGVASPLDEIRKKRKRKTLTVDAPGHPSSPSTDKIEEATASEKASKRKRKSKPDAEVSENTVNPVEGAAEDKPRKKKRKYKEQETTHAEVYEPVDSESLKHKNKKAHSSSKAATIPNPAEDAKLSESALKALLYVYAKVSSHSDWKFNKARQNWVIRNVWDNEAVPETYFASCVKYLASVQGNTRDVLIKSSRSFLDPSASKPEPEVTTSNNHEAPKPDEDDGKAEQEQLRRTQMKVERAREILAALGADTES